MSHFHGAADRRSRRARARLEHVAWSGGRYEPVRRAEVRDRSASGIALILDAGPPPPVGRTIRVLARRGPVPRRALVVRHARNPDGRPVVACRWAGAADGRLRGLTGRRRAQAAAPAGRAAVDGARHGPGGDPARIAGPRAQDRPPADAITPEGERNHAQIQG
jgi:hypothetical protein